MTDNNMLKSRRLKNLRELYDGEDMNLVISEAKKLHICNKLIEQLNIPCLIPPPLPVL